MLLAWQYQGSICQGGICSIAACRICGGSLSHGIHLARLLRVTFPARAGVHFGVDGRHAGSVCWVFAQSHSIHSVNCVSGVPRSCTKAEALRRKSADALKIGVHTWLASTCAGSHV